MDEREYRTAAEVAADLGVSLRTVRRWIADGELPAIKIGRSVRVHRSVYGGALGAAGASTMGAGAGAYIAGGAAYAGAIPSSAAVMPGTVVVPVVWRHLLRSPAGRSPDSGGAVTPQASGEGTDVAEARRRAAEGMDRLVPRGRPPAGTHDTADALIGALRAGWSERLVEAASLPPPAGSASGTAGTAPGSTPGAALVSTPGAALVPDVLQVAGKVVLDASVILRWLLRGEDDADRALALRGRIVAGAVQAFVPPHAPLEIADALRSAAEHGRVSQMAVLPLLRAVEALRLEVADPWGYAADSLAVARELGIGVADAAGIVAARRSGATLVTTSRSLVGAASASGDSVAWLGEVKA